ncbi:MAG: PDZ domain-containing protein [Spirochaetes bacterium]|nr:PDZ domain-containing protein [Spirochaetota bacterium]
MNKKRFLHFGIIIFICGFLFGMTFSLLKSQQENSFKYLDQFHFLYRVIQSEYVENVSPKTLFRGAMRGMLQSLNDPYSRFLDETDYADFKGGVTGRFTGIGVELTIKNEAVVVISPIEDSPAHKSGIRSGDTILQLNGTQVKSDNYQDLIKDIRDKN